MVGKEGYSNELSKQALARRLHQIPRCPQAKRLRAGAVQDLGYAEAATQKWVSAVMFGLRMKVEEERLAERMGLKTLYEDLQRASVHGRTRVA